MKKILFYFAAILLVSTVGMSSCSSNDDKEETTSPTSTAAGYWTSGFDSTLTIEMTETSSNTGTVIFTMMQNNQLVTKTGQYVYYPTKKSGYVTATNGSDLYFNFTITKNEYDDTPFLTFKYNNIGGTLVKSQKK